MDVVSFAFTALAFIAKSKKKKKKSAKTNIKDFTLLIFFKESIISGSYVQVFTHFELIFVDGVRW